MLDMSVVFASFPMLVTERCVLRPVTLEDVPAIFRMMNDPQVNRYLGRKPMASLDEAVKRVNMFQATFQEQTGIPWGITLRDGGQLIGTCVFWNLNKPHYRAELGYILAPEWWGQGLVSEVVRAVLAFGFTTMGLHSVEAQMDPDNTASRRVLEKIGFVQEGYFRENFYDPVKERFTDTAVLSLLKSTWQSRLSG